MISITEILKSNLNKTKKGIIANHIAAGQMTSGKTSKMLEVENVNIAGGQLTGWKYSMVWETGRKPGKMPPIAGLKSWVELKLGLSGAEALGMAWGIAKKISQEGTKLHQSGGRKDIITNEVTKLADNLAKDLGNILTEQLVNPSYNGGNN